MLAGCHKTAITTAKARGALAKMQGYWREMRPRTPNNPVRGRSSPAARGCKLGTQRCARQPFVTTGGGALPLPVWAQPATLSSAIMAAIAIATFFIPHLLFRY